MENRWNEIRNLWVDNQWLYVTIGVFIGILLNPLIVEISSDLLGFLRGLLPEAVGIGFTVLILERLSRRETIVKEKRDLLAQMSSPDNSVTRQAIKILWARKWLQEGVAQNASLWGANLEDADLGECDLRGANLWIANLRKARLWADLRGAQLHNADLCEAQLSSNKGEIKFDETTTLPDGSKWTSDTDITRFTNPQHPDFWRSDDKRSPAYEAK